MIKKFLSVLTVLVMSLAMPAMAADSVTIVIGFSAGGGSDRIAQQVKSVLESKGKKVTIEYRPGAGGDVAAKLVANDSSSSVRLLMKGTSKIVMRNLEPQSAYDYSALQPVVYLGYVPMILAVHRDYGVSSLDEYLKGQRPAPTYGSSGVGSGTHLSGALFFSAVNRTMVHVPYKGSSAVMPDLIAGRINMAMVFPIQALPHIRTGDLKALAVAGSRRLDAIKDVPTLDEKNLQQAYGKLMYVLFANPGSPASDVIEIQNLIRDSLQHVAVQQNFREQADLEVEPQQVLETRKILAQEFAKYRKLVQQQPELLAKK